MFDVRCSFVCLILLAILLTPGLGFAVEEEVPWHVKEAEVRVPLSISIEEVLRRMPPDVYLADLKPIETKGLSFDPETKAAVQRDRRSAEEKAKMIAAIKVKCQKTGQKFNSGFYQPQMWVFDSATFQLKPEYKWFSCLARLGRDSRLTVFVDEKKLFDESNYRQRDAPIMQVVAIPSGAKTLRIEADTPTLREAGFVSRNPVAAEATFCLPGRDPTSLIPLVYDLKGRPAGCRILWTQPTEPMSILFDTSSGENRYMVYLVDRAKNPPRLDWTPKAGLILEGRYPDRYDPAINTLEGFMKLWDETDCVAGKLPQESIMRQIFPFRPMGPDAPNYRISGRRIGQGPGEAPLALTRYTGFFHAPRTQEYKFLFGVRPGGYLLLDDQPVLRFPHDGAVKMWQEAEDEQLASELPKDQTAEPVREIEGLIPFQLKLDQGRHKIDVCQYGSGGRFDARLIWYSPENPKDSVVFGSGFRVWEPLVRAAAGTMTHREKKPIASFTWRYGKAWMPRSYPAMDIVSYSFAAKLSPEREGAVFRWRFDDGHTTEGREIEHLFFSVGPRKVEIEVMDGPGGKMIACAAGTVRVHVEWSWPEGHKQDGEFWNSIVKRQGEFGSVTPIREVVSLYYWMLQTNWLEKRLNIGAALAGRIDEVIAEYPHSRLLEMARYMAEPIERHYAAAEKLLMAVMDRAPVGGQCWKSAAAGLADILVSVRGEPDKGLRLLETAEKAEPAIDMDPGWRTAKAKQWYPRTPDGGDLAAATKDLDWSEPSHLSFRTETEDGRGTWIAKDFLIPASRKGKDLQMDLGLVPYNGMIWFNGKLLGERWDAPEGPIVVPPEMQHYDRENRFLMLFQPPEHQALAGRNPTLQGLSGAEGIRFTLVATDLYTSPSCVEKGVQYTCYKGDWQSYSREHGTFPELDTMKPIKNGTLTDLAFAELRVGSLGHHMPRVGTESRIDMSAVGIEPPFVVKLAGYVRVSPGVYRFRHRNRGGVFVDSRPATLTDRPIKASHGVGPGGAVFLRGGVHFLEMVYFCDREDRWINVIVPDTYVPNSEGSAKLVKVDGLLLKGEKEKAREILRQMNLDAPPIDEKMHLKLSSDLRRVYRWAEKGGLGDAIAALDTLGGWLGKYPLLRVDPEFMAAKVEAYAGMGDHERAFTLARQMRQMDMNDVQCSRLMLVQVRASIKAGNMDAARDIYKELKELAPYSTATIAAREAITEAVKRKYRHPVPGAANP
jgi:hypothetical protein